MRKIIQTPSGFQIVNTNNPEDIKYFNEEELAMKTCEDCKSYMKK